jgi:DMSO/TMAO reductase YedYZ molybdopterin-dependent catalytic subunit
MARARRLFLLLVCALTLVPVAVLVIGCGGGGSADTGGSNTVLEVVGPDGAKSYTLDQIRDMPSAEGYAGTKSSTGRITTPVLVKGVPLKDLFAEVGGMAEDAAVGVVAKDGYEMTLSAEQITAGDFITYDMVTGEEKTVDGPLTAVIAYEYDGKPLDPEGDGPLRMYVVSPERNQVTDGHWSVKWVTKVQAKAIVQEWTLALKGKLTEEMDRSTFESGSAVGCHGQEWTDAEGNKWTGIPLYLLVGRVDDDIAHDGPAYNRDLAEAGYQVLVKTAAGKSVELASGTMYYNKHLIVAYKLNGEALPEEYWPLRLVGEGIDASDMVGQITEIEALVPAE